MTEQQVVHDQVLVPKSGRSCDDVTSILLLLDQVKELWHPGSESTLAEDANEAQDSWQFCLDTGTVVVVLILILFLMSVALVVFAKAQNLDTLALEETD